MWELQFSTIVIMCVFYILICLVVIPLGIGIGIKLYNKVKDEEHNEKGKVIQKIIKTYSIVQCVAWPLILLICVLIMIANQTHFSESHQSLMNTLKSIWRFLFILTCQSNHFNNM